MGMEPIQWDVDSLDWKDYDAGTICSGCRISWPGVHRAVPQRPKPCTRRRPALGAGVYDSRGYTVVPIRQLIYWENYTIDHRPSVPESGGRQ